MTTLFWLALVLGGGLALLSLLGDFLGFDHGGDTGGDVGGDLSAGHIDHDAAHILSLRSATYFLFAFGAVGVLLDWAWEGRMTLAALLFAAGTGFAASTFSVKLFRWVARSSSGELPHDTSLIGLPAHIVLPLHDGYGKVLVTRGGREHELMARPFDADAPDAAQWHNVIVVDVVDGTALVSPLDEQSSETLLPPEATESES
ncbi:MAG: hypothetical protein FIB01_11670 [Gemmatimonadetes bacterium]|nr:hypothetical protein [Gemmatimonadota bacterium]